MRIQGASHRSVTQPGYRRWTAEVADALFVPHEAQAQANHGQSVARLSERGGLSPCEAVAILLDRRWEPMDEEAAWALLADIVGAAREERY
jgi:lambda repressor-like predicted transcriptional regulator